MGGRVGQNSIVSAEEDGLEAVRRSLILIYTSRVTVP